jgi:phosphate-selective porin OprO/OprP
MLTKKYVSVLLALASLAVVSPGRLAAASSDELQALREQIQQLEQKLRVLERKQELKDDDAAAAAKTAVSCSSIPASFSAMAAAW